MQMLLVLYSEVLAERSVEEYEVRFAKSGRVAMNEPYSKDTEVQTYAS